MTENEISFKIRGAIYTTYKSLGPGLLESSYEAVLKHLLCKDGLFVHSQAPLPLVYEEVTLDVGYRIDLLVENKVIVEVKSVEQLTDVHYKQLLTYLKLSDKKLGLLVNFNTANMLHSIHRIVNGL
ncbi:MAG TPA: GxxExxY protein [Bacteroidales bacterium]|nr:GxxExxY protein [Bacteroidales bacterium]HRZ49994.1 GxxExxY protein [Bacteroidales bacterium]